MRIYRILLGIAVAVCIYSGAAITGSHKRQIYCENLNKRIVRDRIAFHARDWNNRTIAFETPDKASCVWAVEYMGTRPKFLNILQRQGFVFVACDWQEHGEQHEIKGRIVPHKPYTLPADREIEREA